MTTPKRPCVLRRTLRTAASAIAGAVLVSVPAVAAHAAFTASAAATTSMSSRTLAAPNPATTPVTATCPGKGKRHQLDITVGAFTPVPGANYHRLTITDPAGAVQQSAALSPATGGSYSNASAAAGVWTYEIRGDFLVPGSSNTWTGAPMRGTVTCF